MNASQAAAQPDPTAEIIARRDRCMTINYARYPIAMARGEGSVLHDGSGKRYVDLFAGFGAGLLGHCHPELIAAVTEQAGRLWHVGNLFHTEPQTRLAEAIHTQGFQGRSYFCHSGADANEAAFKLARLYGRARPGDAGPRYKVISAVNSFHGRSFGAMAATGQKKVSEGFAPLAPGFVHVPYADLSAIEAALDDQTVAVIVEPIQGEGGVVIPPDDYLPGLRRLCDERDLLWIGDEVWCGGGRTGRWFAHQHWNVTPDVMTLAKGVGGGLPVGVMCASERCADRFDWSVHGGVAHATTLGGNCLSMAVAARVFEVVEREGLVERAAKLGESIVERLRDFASTHPCVREVRGKGLFLGIELDPQADGQRAGAARHVVNACMEKGVLINATQDTVIRLAPPLNIPENILDQGLSVLEQVLRHR